MEVGIIPPRIPPINFFDPYYHSVHLVMVVVLGACFGSFFNVCIYRIPRGVSLSRPGSHCYRCGEPVRWFDNIPILSYWILRGRCRHCGATFSARYFLVELATALIFLWVFLRVGYSLAFIPAIVFTSLLIIATFTDINHWIIPDRISLGGMVAGIVLAAAWPIGLAPGNPLAVRVFPVPETLSPLANSLAGAAAGFAALWLIGWLGSVIFRKEAMGWGDMKLFAMFGAFCGLEPLLYILILACFVGSVVGVTGMAAGSLAERRARPAPAVAGWPAGDAAAAAALLGAHALGAAERRVVRQALERPGSVGARRHHLPFGPSLAVAAFVVYLYGETIRAWFYSLVLGGGYGVW